MDEKSFGEIVQEFRRKRGWTVKAFIEQLGLDISPAYITKIEIHGEIPAPSFIGKIADLFKIDYEKLLAAAKSDKVRHFTISLDKKYHKAIGLYRLQRRIK